MPSKAVTMKDERRPEVFSYVSADGLRLSAEDRSGPDQSAPCVLCLHGLTRNGRDFDRLAAALARSYRVICPDQRGRGRSAYDPNPLNYNVMTQTQDMWRLLDARGVETCAVVGTSMGGLMGVLMATEKPERISALVLNDVGPEADPRGIARIAGYVGENVRAANWDAAADALKRVHGASFPTYTYNDWARMAHATFREDGESLRLDYDPALATALKQIAAGALDLWPMFEVLRRTPTLVLRGALSDILSEETLLKMQERFPSIETRTIEHRGHAPDLSEPDATEAILEFLSALRIQN